MQNRITAEQARSLMPFNAQNEVDKVYKDIRFMSSSGKSKLHLHDAFWTRQAYEGSSEYKLACEILQNDGFHVEFFYEERQFVDMYTIVSW